MAMTYALISNHAAAYDPIWTRYFIGQTKCSQYHPLIVPSGFCITINADGSVTSNNAKHPEWGNSRENRYTSVTLAPISATYGVRFDRVIWYPIYQGGGQIENWAQQMVLAEPNFTADDRLHGRPPTSWSIRVLPAISFWNQEPI